MSDGSSPVVAESVFERAAASSASASARATDDHVGRFVGDGQMITSERRILWKCLFTINRELTVLKRMFSLAIQAGKLVHKPHFPMLRENNVRAGFFEREQNLSVQKHLPTSMQPVVTFAYVTGWRINSEVLPLQWRQLEMEVG